MKYTKMCQEILAQIGGKENIKDCFHCLTRLRITPHDLSKVNVDGLKKIDGLLTVQVVGTQVQCVVGQQVGEVYKEFCQMADFTQGQSAPAAQAPAPEKKKLTPQSILNAVIDAISSCVQPLLPIIICGGMVKLVAALIGPQLLNLAPEGSDLYTLIQFVGDAAFYFLPVFVGYTGAKKFGCSMATGMIMGAVLIHPTLLGLVNEGASFTVYGIPMTLVNYSSTIVPMILITWVMSYIEKFFDRIMPNMLKMMFVPMLTLFVMLPIALCILGPLGNIIGTAISGFLLWLADALGPFGIALVSALWILLTMAGMHLPIILLAITNLFTVGYENVVLVAGGMTTFAVLGMCLGFLLKAKTSENKSLGLSCFTSQLLGGVCEPALYGIGLRFRRPMIAQILGAAIGGLVAGFLHVAIYNLGNTNILFLITFISEKPSTFVFGCVSCLVSFLAAMILTFVLGFDESK